MDPARGSLPRKTTVRTPWLDTGFILLTMIQDNSARGLDNKHKEGWQGFGQRIRPGIAPTDHWWHPRVRRMHVLDSVWQQVLPLGPDWVLYLGDCDADGPGGHYNGDGQAEIWIDEDYAVTSISCCSGSGNLQIKDWAALNSSLYATRCLRLKESIGCWASLFLMSPSTSRSSRAILDILWPVCQRTTCDCLHPRPPAHASSNLPQCFYCYFPALWNGDGCPVTSTLVADSFSNEGTCPVKIIARWSHAAQDQCGPQEAQRHVRSIPGTGRRQNATEERKWLAVT